MKGFYILFNCSGEKEGISIADIICNSQLKQLGGELETFIITHQVDNEIALLSWQYSSQYKYSKTREIKLDICTVIIHLGCTGSGFLYHRERTLCLSCFLGICLFVALLRLCRRCLQESLRESQWCFWRLSLCSVVFCPSTTSPPYGSFSVPFGVSEPLWRNNL